MSYDGARGEVLARLHAASGVDAVALLAPGSGVHCLAAAHAPDDLRVVTGWSGALPAVLTEVSVDDPGLSRPGAALSALFAPGGGLGTVVTHPVGGGALLVFAAVGRVPTGRRLRDLVRRSTGTLSRRTGPVLPDLDAIGEG